MPQWKNWQASPPPRGAWVQTQHAIVGGIFSLDPNSVPSGADMSNVEWLDLTVADPVPLMVLKVLAFKQLFTADEFAAIAASTDHQVMQFLDMVNTPSITSVTLTDALVSGGVNYLESVAHLIAPGRSAQILSNTPHG